MATFLVDFLQSLAGVDCHMTFHFNNLSMPAGVSSAPNELIDEFEDDFVPKINALQSDRIANVSLYARDLGNPGTAITRSITGAGAVTSTAADTMQPSYVANIRRTVTSWTSVVTGSLYIGTRPGRSGRVFLSGLDETWQNDTGGSVPAALAAAWATFLTQWSGTLTLPTGSIVLDHVVWSGAKSALGGMPARDPLVGNVSGGGLIELTRLRTRK